MFRTAIQLTKIKRMFKINSLSTMSTSTSTHSSSPAIQKKEEKDVSIDGSDTGSERDHDRFQNAVSKLRDINRLLQRKNKTKKVPFLLNTYFGIFDRDMLIFPELLGKSDLEFLLEFRKEINNEYEESRQKICGVCAPMLSNGYEMNVTERASISEDVFWSNDLNSVLSVSDHSTVVKVLEQFGSDEIKAKYLRALVNGDLKATICFTEDGFMQNSILETFAFTENNEWIVNGIKSHVRSALDADIFLVLVDSCKETHSERSVDFLSAFLIEKKTEGISIKDCSPGRHSVIFDKVKVPPVNMVGKTNMAINILEMITNDSRIMSSIHSIIVQRKLIAKVIEFANTTNADKFPLAHSDYFKRLLSTMTKDLYASESMLYLGAGMSDLYENMPCYVENSAMRVFAVEATLRAFTSAKQALGPDTLKPDHFVAKLEREFSHNLLLPESTDMSQLAMSYCAIKHSHDRFHNEIAKSRNVMYNSRFNFINTFRMMRDHFDDPKMYMDLEGFLHPTLTKQAQSLEYCVQRLHYAFKQSLTRNGVETIDRQVELIQISKIAVYIYAMTATLARASRSYCIGLQNAELEMFLAGLLCQESRQAVQKLAEVVGEGPISSQEQIYLNLAISFYSDKEYSVSHPLCRNYD